MLNVLLIFLQHDPRDMNIHVLMLYNLFCKMPNARFKGSGDLINSILEEMNPERIIAGIQDRIIMRLLLVLQLIPLNHTLKSQNRRHDSNDLKLCTLSKLLVLFDQLLRTRHSKKAHTFLVL